VQLDKIILGVYNTLIITEELTAFSKRRTTSSGVSMQNSAHGKV